MERVQEELEKTDEMILTGEGKLNAIKQLNKINELEKEAKLVSGKSKRRRIEFI